MYDLFQKLCEKYNVDYADLLFARNDSERVYAHDLDISISRNSTCGTGLRILKNGQWSISSSTEKMPVEKLFRETYKLSSKRLEGTSKIDFKPQKPIKDKHSTRFKIDPFMVHEKEKVKLLTNVKKNIVSPQIKTTRSVVVFAKSDERFINSEGSDIETSYCKSIFMTSSIARKGDNIQPVTYRRAFISGYEGPASIDIERITSDLKSKAERMLNAKSAPAGKFTIVCDPELTGLFFHEAVGHACEADSVLNKTSILRGKVGDKIASGKVTLTDDPRKRAWGNYKYDDEGIPASSTEIISKGILRGYIHSRETASRMGVEPTGNGRSDSTFSFPIPRMSNLVVKRGEQSFLEITDLKKGIYAKGLGGGQVDIIKGNFIFGCEEAFLIEKGEISTPLREVSFSGNILTSLKKIDAVGNKAVRTAAGGTCGKKGQFVPVGEISPHIRIRNVMVGGRQ